MIGRVVSVVPSSDGRFALVALKEPMVPPVTMVCWTGARLPLGTEVEVDDQDLRMKASDDALHVMTLVPGGSIEQTGRCERVVSAGWADLVASKMLRALLPSQRVGAAWLAKRMSMGLGGILADEPGLGKTTQAIAAVAAVGAWPCLVVCPAALPTNWQHEFGFVRGEVVVQHLESTRTEIRPAHVYTLSTSLLRAREEELLGLRLGSMIIDEAHDMKRALAPTTHRAEVATRLARRVRRVVLLTGTPVLNRANEVWRLLHMVAPASWPSYEDFRERFCAAPKEDEFVPRHLSSVVTSQGRIERLEELQALIEPHMLRRRRADVMQDLPPKTKKIELVELDGAARATYDQAALDVIAWMKRVGLTTKGMTPADEAKTLLKLSMLRRIAGLGKVRSRVREALRAWDKDEPLLIFGWHKAVLTAALEEARAAGLVADGWTRGTSRKRRQKTIEDFMACRTQVLLLGIRAGGVGLNLQRSSNVWFLERSWVPADLEQGESRVHRMGQRRPVTATYWDAKDTIDEDMEKALADKALLASMLIDDEDPEEVTRKALTSVVNRMCGLP